jgi:hypothetical protein
VRRPAVELAEFLVRARAEGKDWWDAWLAGVSVATHGRRDGEMWREVFSETSSTWKAAYELEPATSRDRAAALLADAALGDVQTVPDRACAFCGGDMDAAGRAPNAIYCSQTCNMDACHERERGKRAARCV